jgi:hypothetical protein
MAVEGTPSSSPCDIEIIVKAVIMMVVIVMMVMAVKGTPSSSLCDRDNSESGNNGGCDSDDGDGGQGNTLILTL